MVKLQCPRCKETLEVPDSLAGQKETCPTCGYRVPIPPKSPLDLLVRDAEASDTPNRQHSPPPPKLSKQPANKKQCTACKEWIAKDATKCPYCQTTQPSASAAIGGLLAGVLAIVLAIMFANWILSPLDCDVNGTSSSDSRRSPSVSADRLATMEDRIDKMLSSGAVHSMNVEFNEVRIDPLLWVRMRLDAKQNFVMFFSEYFDAKGSTARVTVLSNRNDKKLATYGVWGGLDILE